MQNDQESIMVTYPQNQTDDSVQIIAFSSVTVDSQSPFNLKHWTSTGTSISSDLYMFDYSDLVEEVRQLRREIEIIKGILIHEFDEMSKEEIKEIILKHVEENGAFWPDELADDLNLDPVDVIEVCEELRQEGRLKALDPDEVPRKYD